MTATLYFYAIGILLAGALNTLFAFSVYIKNRKNISSIVYALLSLAFAVWCYSWFAMLLVKDNETLALFFARLLNFGAIFIPAFYFHWVLSILGLEKKNKRNILACYLITIFFVVLSWTSSFVQGVHPILFFPYWPTAGYLYIFYLIFGYLIFSAYGVYLLFKNLLIIKKTDKIKRNQIIYVLLGSSMGLGGAALNFFLMYNINPFGPFFEAGMFIGLMIFAPFAIPLAYATMKYHLMDIKIVFTEMLAGLISATLLIDSVFSIFTSATPLVIVFKFSVFLIFSYFGVTLIRSVLREIEQREKIENMAKEVERAYEIEKKANEELKKLDQYKNDFMRQAQHDLRTPLTVMMGYSDLLLDGSYGKLPKQAADVIKRIIAVTQDKLKDINNFLDIEQFKMGKGVVSLKPGIELLPILEEITNVLNSKARSKGIYLKLEKLEKTLTINVDREKLKAAIFNIVDNAIKFTEKGGVDIKIQNDEAVKIIISDTGIGIPHDKIKSIFETQFERTIQAQKTAAGSGVGLYLSAQIIKLHNGKVWVESEGEGKGSTFHIELPVKIDGKIKQ